MYRKMLKCSVVACKAVVMYVSHGPAPKPFVCFNCTFNIPKKVA